MNENAYSMSYANSFGNIVFNQLKIAEEINASASTTEWLSQNVLNYKKIALSGAYILENCEINQGFDKFNAINTVTILDQKWLELSETRKCYRDLIDDIKQLKSKKGFLLGWAIFFQILGIVTMQITIILNIYFEKKSNK